MFELSRFTSKAHILGAVLWACGSDAELAVIVVAPALNNTTGHDRARVRLPQGEGNGRIA